MCFVEMYYVRCTMYKSTYIDMCGMYIVHVHMNICMYTYRYRNIRVHYIYVNVCSLSRLSLSRLSRSRRLALTLSRQHIRSHPESRETRVAANMRAATCRSTLQDPTPPHSEEVEVTTARKARGSEPRVDYGVVLEQWGSA